MEYYHQENKFIWNFTSNPIIFLSIELRNMCIDIEIFSKQVSNLDSIILVANYEIEKHSYYRFEQIQLQPTKSM